MTEPAPDRLRDLLDDLAGEPVAGSVGDVRQRLARRRRNGQLAAAVMTVVVAVGVVVPVVHFATNGTKSLPNATSSPEPSSSSPLRLIGLWRVEDAGEKPGTSLIFGEAFPLDVDLLRPCGDLSGDWNADNEGQLVANVTGGSQKCFTDHTSTAAWLSRVTNFRSHGNDELLLAGRAVVARLVPEKAVPAKVEPDPKQEAALTVPTVDAIDRSTFREPAPLPEGVQPATMADLVGRWDTLDKGQFVHGFVRFDADGDWTGSDGCNGYLGRYQVGSDGRFINFDGPNGAVGCVGSPAPGWLYDTERMGISGHTLLFYSATGKLLGSVEREPKGAIHPGSLKVCAAVNLRGRFGPVVGTTGIESAPLLLTNTSNRSCTLRGYVHLQRVAASGRPMNTVVHHSDNNDDPFADPGPQRLVVQPGETVSAGLSWVDNATGPTYRCPSSLFLIVTPPGQSTKLTIATRAPDSGGERGAISTCSGDLQLSALQPGPKPQRL